MGCGGSPGVIDAVDVVRRLAQRLGRIPDSKELHFALLDAGISREEVEEFLDGLASSGRPARPAVREPVAPAATPPSAAHVAPPEPPSPPPALASPPAAGRAAAVDAAVARAVEDLIDDWYRAGKRLEYDDVVRLASKRQLSAEQLSHLLSDLADEGVALDDSSRMPGAGRDDEAEDPSRARAADVRVSDDVVHDHLRAASRHRLLTAEDEVRLMRQIRAGEDAEARLADGVGLRGRERDQLADLVARGRSARDEFAAANQRLVVKIAAERRHQHCGVDFADRIQDGNIGLLRAIDLFDYERGLKFSTYATYWVNQSIGRGAANTGRTIRVPVHALNAMRKVRAVRRRLTRQYDREPTIEEIARHTDMTPAQVQSVIDHDRTTVSLSTPIGDGDITLGDLLSAEADVDGRNDPAEVALASARSRDLQEVIELLGDKPSTILTMRYGLLGHDPMVLEDIGDVFGLTRERIRQIVEKSLTELRGMPEARPLYEYLVDLSWHDEILYSRTQPPPAPQLATAAATAEPPPPAAAAHPDDMRAELDARYPNLAHADHLGG